MKKILLIIDPQNDFVDPKGSLYVKGAEEVIKNIADYVKNKGSEYDEVVVTLDTHRRIHISLQNGWTHKPKPFTTIVKEVGDNLELTATNLEFVYYGTGIKIWPDHCIIGTWGHCIPEILVNALSDWEVEKRRGVFYQRKGENCGYEAYSALTTEILTGVKPKWRTWKDVRTIDICGFCKDICVAETVKDLSTRFDGEIRLFSNYCATLDPNSENLKILNELEKTGEIKITV